ncbi:MAG: hypothetical protein ACOYOK_02295 [Pseudobdellovibrionaceae bacterium]
MIKSLIYLAVMSFGFSALANPKVITGAEAKSYLLSVVWQPAEVISTDVQDPNTGLMIAVVRYENSAAMCIEIKYPEQDIQDPNSGEVTKLAPRSVVNCTVQ